MGLQPEAVAQMIDQHFPEASGEMGAIDILSCGDGRAQVRLPYEDRFARPGGTISGPTMFSLADMTCYVAIISDLGRAGIDSATTTLTINFLSRPEPADLLCEGEVLRRGRRQIVCDTRIFSGAVRKLVAQASCIYALPMT